MKTIILKRFQADSRLKFELHQGFTLIELLVALVITTIVIGLTGSGLYALMNADRRSQTETSDRLELEQALAFMSDEIKMSQHITNNNYASVNKITGFNDASGSKAVRPILVLQPPPNSGLTNPIVYYLAEPPNKSVWLGPRVIYRWGPTLLQNGNYSDGDGNNVLPIVRGSTVKYYNEVLVDRISDRVTDKAKIACESSYNYAAPNLADRLGFYACIAPDQKSVKLWINKQPNLSGRSQSIDALVVTRSN